MADPTARTLRLLSLLQTHEFWSGTELAGRLGVSVRTLRRDVDRLRELGYPVAATPGVSGGYRLAAGSHLPPLLIDDDEAVAIAVGLSVAAGAAVAGIEETALRAMVKLQQLLPDRLRRRVTAVHGTISVRRGEAGPTVDPSILTVLALACRDHEEVRFDYERRDGERASRLVRPHQLVCLGRRWYLVGWDVRRDAWRTFRLDRMRGARLAGVRFAPLELPGGDAADYVHRSFQRMPHAHVASVEVTAGEEELTDVIRWLDAEVHRRPGGRWQLVLRSEALGWLVVMIATLAVRFDVRIEGDEDLLRLLAVTGQRLHGAATPAPESSMRSGSGAGVPYGRPVSRDGDVDDHESPSGAADDHNL